jgi:hypothetical protein
VRATSAVIVSAIYVAACGGAVPVRTAPTRPSTEDRFESRDDSGARFRPKLDSLRRDKEYWSRANNPFSGTRELKGLLVVWDLGASLGETGKLFPRRNWVDGFERRGFITWIDGDRVAFDYDGRHQALLHMITPADVRWAGQRTARLTVRQWRDAFRSAHYDDEVAERSIARIRQKIDDGLALRVRPAGGRQS